MEEFITNCGILVHKLLNDLYLEFESKASADEDKALLKLLIGKITTISVKEEQNNGCVHLLYSGIRKGKPCGKNTILNSNFCKKHFPKCCQTRDCNKDISKYSPSGTMCKIHIKDELGRKAHMLKRNNERFMEHPPTGLLFQSGVVVGKKDETSFTDLDYECIKAYGFGLDEKLLSGMSDYLNRTNHN